jgi:RHS repeat-associated protein
MASETETHGTNPAKITNFSYIGMTQNLAEEQQSSGASLQTTKDYSYDITGHRLTMTVTPASSTPTTYSYGYDVHGSVSLLVDPSGNAKATYGYTPYGAPDSAVSQGDTDPTNPLNQYRYSAQRMDTASASLAAGSRNFDPATGHYLQQDLFNGSMSDAALAGDPLNQNRYALGGGNPLSLKETDGHVVTEDGGGGAFTWPNPDPPPPPKPPSRAKPCNGFFCAAAGIGVGLFDTGRDLVGGVGNLGGAAVHAVTHPAELPGDAAAIASTVGTDTATFIHDPGGTSRKILANGFQAAAGAVDQLHTAFTSGDDFSRFRAYSHFTSSFVATALPAAGVLKKAGLLGDIAKGARTATAAAGDVGPASSALNGLRLNAQLASESQVAGPGDAIIGAGTKTPLHAAERLAAQYGGDPYSWAKMTSPTYSNGWGLTFSTHWYENLETGLRVEWKTVFGR